MPCYTYFPAQDDYNTSTIVAVFYPNSNSTMCISIIVIQDGVVENDTETFQVGLSSSDSAVTLTRPSVPVIIFESDCKRAIQE